jgi:hypothetical protein
MNSVIQQLFLVPGIKEALLSIDDEDADEETLFFQFQMVMGHLQVISNDLNECSMFPTRSF